MSKSFWEHPIETIEKALHVRKQIEALEANLREIYGNGRQPLSSEKPVPATKDGRKGKRSPATIAKMKAAQQARHAKKKGAAPSAVQSAKKKRTFSAKSRAKMAAAAKARWAKRLETVGSMPNKLIW